MKRNAGDELVRDSKQVCVKFPRSVLSLIEADAAACDRGTAWIIRRIVADHYEQAAAERDGEGGVYMHPASAHEQSAA